MKQGISQKWFFQKSPKEVWDYLTKPELLAEWLMENDFKPVVGHKFQFRNTRDAECNCISYCEVLEITPLKQLSYTWKSKNGEADVDSIVTWTLTQKNDGTELQLQHNGFTVLGELHSHADGWAKHVNLLTRLLHANAESNTNALNYTATK